jgi:hypothetical protein
MTCRSCPQCHRMSFYSNGVLRVCAECGYAVRHTPCRSMKAMPEVVGRFRWEHPIEE